MLMRAAGVAAAAFALLVVYVLSGPGLGRRERASEFALRDSQYLFNVDELTERQKKEEGHAWEWFEWWYGQRAYPNALIPKSAFWDAHVYAQENLVPSETGGLRAATWRSIGPDNVGGRMLAVVLDPSNPSTVWAGSASGGLWKSTTAGAGAAAWTRIETGFPTLSVSAIVIDPTNPNVMYLGTGEISRYERPLVGTPGARSSYGLGIVKSTDAGSSWSATGLTWTFDQSRAVLSIKMDPTDSQTLWAATSEGLYKTTDGGASWSLSHAELMAMDVVIDPTSANTVYVSHGQLGVPADPDAGVYKTTNGGSTWTQLGGGLPTTDFGRTPLAISADGSRIFAGVSSAASRQVVGLYRSTNGGSSWSNLNGTNWASSQAWYDNIVGVSPHDQDLVICAGLDCYRSTNGGSSLNQVTGWYLGYDGIVPAGGPEGPSDYVHADQHGIAFHPTDPDIIYIACDGGIFVSENGGVDWAGRNGGLRTTQFYAGFANGYSTQALALGGLQDNGTLKYVGTDSWDKTFGGDGGWCAIDPSNESVLYEEYIYLNMHKSTNGGSSWFEIHDYSSGEANFIAPFVICESSPSTLYGGMKSVHKTTNGGSSWFYPDGDSDWNGTQVATIGVSFTNANKVMAGTGNSGAAPTIEVRRSTNGGSSWTDVSSWLPDRYPTDFTYDPNDDQNVWAAFSGYGTGHVFRSTDSGLTWTDASGNLPDIPAQSVAVDPLAADWVYVGTDLGVFRTIDGGATWTDFNDGMPTAMICDLVVKRDDRLMRAATFGNGVWEVDLPGAATGVEVAARGSSGASVELMAPRPNPFRIGTTVRYAVARDAAVRISIHDQAGRRVRTLLDGARSAGPGEVPWDGRDEAGRRVAAGVYFVRLEGAGEVASTKLTLLR